MSNPYDSPADQLIANFYAWEKRGRGWDLYPYPVELEPPFRPFFEHVYVLPRRGNDGRKPGVLASLFGRPCQSAPALPSSAPETEEEPTATSAAVRQLSELQVVLPPDFEPARDAVDHLLTASRVCSRPVSFELIGRSDVLCLQLACNQGELMRLEEQVQVLAPDAALLRADGSLASAWQEAVGHHLIVDLGLSSEFMRPLRLAKSFKRDPLASLVAALSAVGQGEVAVVQVLYQKTSRPWAESMLRLVHDNEGDPFFATGPELVIQTKHKIASPLLACRIRLAARAASRNRQIELVRGLLAALGQFTTPVGNELIALDTAGWRDDDQVSDLLNRTSHRTGMLLNADELASLVHFPGKEVVHPRFLRQIQHTRPAPDTVLGHGLVLGENSHNGQVRTVTLSPEQRMRHTYLVGASGTGKSTLLLKLILQDLEAGQGVAVFDPHGDLVDSVLARMPRERTDDVVLIDPADEEYPIGCNVLSAHSELERTLLASDLVAVFRRLSTSWGDQMNSVFANAILAFLESSAGGTLAELRRFLVDKQFREGFLATVQDPDVVFYWQREFPLLRGNPQAPILTRLDAFLRPKLIRRMVCQKTNRLDFARIMDSGGVVLAKLSHGAIGEENSFLLGALLVAKLHQTALSRQEQEASTRRPFYLYADEFHHFVTPSMASLLSGVRKYRLGLTLAHQDLQQLGGPTSEIASSVLGNAATRIVFRVGDTDAKRLAEGFAHFETQDLLNLSTGEAICRVERSSADFNLTVPDLEPLDAPVAAERRAQVREASRKQFATSAAEMEIATPEPVPPPAHVEEPPPAMKIQVPAVAPLPSPTPASPRKPVAPASLGRGGQQHKYLQTLIKRFGEDRGFRASIEQPVLDGHGSVDVALEQEGLRIGVEITVTTPTAHELDNISKCLAAGFHQVVLVAQDKTAQKRLSTAIKTHLSEDVHGRVRCVTPEEIPELLDELAVPLPTTQTVAGYKVNVQYHASDPEAKKRHLHGVREIIARSLRRQSPS